MTTLRAGFIESLSVGNLRPNLIEAADTRIKDGAHFSASGLQRRADDVAWKTVAFTAVVQW